MGHFDLIENWVDMCVRAQTVTAWENGYKECSVREAMVMWNVRMEMCIVHIYA